MGKYRATLNMPEAKRGQVAEFVDDEPRVIRMVRDGHLVPVDVSSEALARIEEAKTKPAPVASNSVEAVRRALDERRRAAGISDASASEVSTVVPVEVEAEPAVGEPVSTPVTASVTKDDDEDDKPSFAGSRGGASKAPAKKSPPKERSR